ncbi:hypothetical protein DW886_15865 [Enterocloster aldenensis]|uniref:hypothetical protein n=1 Tax=Enterocloster aldenensis TaxID=358742 RepID=UPI000E4FC61E|nr:hypothetical protein DW886_15865 [Enterocloster aldenensis]
MNLNEAIEHLDDILSEDRWNECVLCKKEHEQLRNWLIELKELRKEREQLKDLAIELRELREQELKAHKQLRDLLIESKN